MENVPVILVVEDEEDMQELYRLSIAHALNGNVEILSARTVQEAEGIFQTESHRLSLVLVDGNLRGGGRSLDAIPLIEMMRKRAKNLPIVATSSSPESREKMRCAGCNHELSKKENAAYLVAGILYET